MSRRPHTRHGWRRALVLAGAWVAIGAAACGGAESPKDTAVLQYKVAEEPGNVGARRQLALRAHEEGRPGEALRELLWVQEVASLSARERALLGTLLVSRGEQRLAVGDPGARADLRRAQGLIKTVDLESRRSANVLCASAALRHSSEFEQPVAAKCLGALPEESLYRRHQELPALGLSELRALWDWFEGAGARKRALGVAQAYVDAGGRDAERLARWKQLHHWWYGTRRPLLPVDAAGQAGADESAPTRFASALGLPDGQSSVSPDGLATDWGVPEWGTELSGLIAGYRRDPALADRYAREFVDRSAYGAPRAAILCELFYRLGDVGRAHNWAQRIVDAAPKHPASHLAAGLGHAVDGDPGRANMFFTAAAAASGDAGATWVLAARAYRRSGLPLDAVAAGRKAVRLTAEGWDMHILLEVSLAQKALGRMLQAEKTEKALWSRFPLADRQAARSLASEFANDKGAGPLDSLLDPLRHQFGFSPLTAK